MQGPAAGTEQLCAPVQPRGYLKTALQKKTYKLNMSQQEALAAKAAMSNQACFSKRVASRSRELIIPFYLNMMRPYPDYCVQ